MKLEDVAIRTNQLETLKKYYIKYFDASLSDKYTNETKGFHSYYLSFEAGARLELMTMPAFLPTRMIRYKRNTWVSFILHLGWIP